MHSLRTVYKTVCNDFVCLINVLNKDIATASVSRTISKENTHYDFDENACEKKGYDGGNCYFCEE